MQLPVQSGLHNERKLNSSKRQQQQPKSAKVQKWRVSIPSHKEGKEQEPICASAKAIRSSTSSNKSNPQSKRSKAKQPIVSTSP